MNILLIFFSLSVLYLLYFALMAFKKRPVTYSRALAESKTDMIFIVPAYRDDARILESVKNILSQADFGTKDEIVVIADSLQTETLEKLYALDTTVVKVKFENNTKAMAINLALKNIQIWKNTSKLVTLLNADNHLTEGFISMTKAAYERGHKVIQTHRIAKNADTPMSILDAISEEINNAVFRLGHFNAGLATALSSSGLVMDYDLFKKYMNKIDPSTSFDKQLELDLLLDKQQIYYMDEVYLLDDKVTNSVVFKNQRSRWIAAQLYFLRSNFFRAWSELFEKRNIDFFNKVIQFAIPPRILLLTFVMLLNLAELTFWQPLYSSFYLTAGLGLVFLISIPGYLYKKISFKTLLNLPSVVFNMAIAMFNIFRSKRRIVEIS